MKYLLGPLTLLFVWLTTCCVWAATNIQGSIVRNEAIPELSLLSSSTLVVLDNGNHVGHVRQDGSFVIPMVADGDYLLEVWTTSLEFPRMKLSVKQGVVYPSVTEVGADWSSAGPELPYPLLLVPRGKRQFFTKREGFSILGLFANPYMLMMGFSVIMLVVMPKMMKSMDPEALQEMQQNQNNIQNSLENMPDISQKLANFFAPNS
ncbi:hypothetical protein BDF19DRAFT_440980 [Syncephalis fuscata]|nr:hypothetical protein BDF19DRAFT_440980 [Syncephalis fuscata]